MKFLSACLFAAFAGTATQPHAAEITLDPGTTYQTISGWEATAGIFGAPNAPAVPARATMLENLVNKVGINRVRLELRSGAESRSGGASRFIKGDLTYDQWKGHRYAMENDNDDPFTIDPDGFDFAELGWHVETTVLPLRRALAARGERLFINLCYVSFRDGWYFQQEPEEYAEFILAAYQHLEQRFGLTPDALEIILEPDSSLNAWDGTKIGRAMAATAKRLQAHGFRPSFIAPSVVDMRHALPMLDDIAGVPGALEHMTEFSYHRYQGNSERRTAAIAERAQTLGLRTSMLEWWFGNGTYEVLHQDLKVGQVSSWQGRAVDGHYRATPAGPELRPEMRYNVQYFRDIRAGAVRIGARSDDREFDPLAFRNASGNWVVVIKADKAGPLTIIGLPPGGYSVSYAVADRSAPPGPPRTVGPDGTLQTEIPGAGVLTVTGD